MKRQPASSSGGPAQPGAGSKVTPLHAHPAREAGLDTGLRAVLDALPQVVFRVDRRARWSWLSAGWSRVTGFDADESAGRRCAEFVHPADRPRFEQQLETLLCGREHEALLRARILCSDGEPRWMEMHAGRGTGDLLVGTLSNITSRVAEENQRRAAQRTLASLINDLPGMVYRCRNNRDWTMEYVSRGARELTGYDPEDLIDNRTLSYASLIHAEDNERVWEEVQLAVNAGEAFDLVYRILTAGGELKWVWERGRGILTSSGELLGLEGFITDITRDHAEREARERTALYEDATGLPTVALFRDRVELALRRRDAGSGAPPVVLVVHLDRFPRPGSDSEAARRAASHAVARTIARALDPADTVARLRDDRLMVLIERGGGSTAAVRAAGTIRDTLRAPVPVGEHSLYLTASTGIAVDDGHSEAADQLLSAALQAVNQARALGGDRWHVHDGTPRGDTP